MEQVKIKILTTQAVDEDKETIRTKTTGTLQTTPNAYILRYQQSGEERPTTLTVDKTAPKAVMEHNGTLVIEQGATHTTPYRMGPYEMDLSVTGKSLLCRLTPKGGNLKLCYELAMNGTPAGETTVELFVE